MGLMDREYMRRDGLQRVGPRTNWRMWLYAASSVIAVASAALWLFRDVRYLVRDDQPAEGSLVVNINTATQPELETVPGIGPTRAVQIIVGRPYASVDDLLRIAGIGPDSLESMRPFVTTNAETGPR